jgi:hypothetical protein
MKNLIVSISIVLVVLFGVPTLLYIMIKYYLYLDSLFGRMTP